jgi:hypothetical protein
MRHHRNFVDAYLKYTDAHESTERVRRWCAISIVAAALERKVFLDLGYYTLYPNLYTFIIGRSGLIKKSTTTGIAVDLFRELKGAHIMSERLTAASLIEQLHGAGREFHDGHRKHKQSAVFAYASELSVFMTEVFGSITELLTTFYDCVPHDSSKPWVNRTIKRGETCIYGPCLNILGASTKAWLRKCIPKSEMEGGFTSRVIFVVENKLPEKLVAWPDFDLERKRVRGELVQDLKHIHTLTGKFSVEADAKALFTRWYENHMRNILPLNQDPRMVGYMSRKGDTIRKLAMVHSAACRDDLTIRTDDLIWASNEIDALEGDWRLAFDGLGTVEGVDYEIMQFVRKKARVTETQVLEVFGQFYPATEVLRALKSLVEMDEISELIVTDEFGSKSVCYQFYAG